MFWLNFLRVETVVSFDAIFASWNTKKKIAYCLSAHCLLIGCYNFRVENRRIYSSGLSSIATTAVLSVAVLLSALVWQVTTTIDTKKASLRVVSDYSKEGRATPTQESTSDQLQAGTVASATNTKPYDSNDLSQIGDNAFGKLIGTYVALKQSGAYTASAGERVAQDIATSLTAPVAYAPILESDIKADSDTSYKRMLQYRSDMRTAYEPLLQNKEPEFAVFARYVETGDKSNLATLSLYAERYKKTATNAKNATVPKDTISYHVRIANSLLQFAAVLEQMVKYADNSMASLALLRTYNSAELEVLTSFNSIATFQRNKTP